MPVDRHVLPLDERPIVPCPSSMREEHRRALVGKLVDLKSEVDHCVRRAHEGRFTETAAAVAQTRTHIDAALRELEVEA